MRLDTLPHTDDDLDSYNHDELLHNATQNRELTKNVIQALPENQKREIKERGIGFLKKVGQEKFKDFVCECERVREENAGFEDAAKTLQWNSLERNGTQITYGKLFGVCSIVSLCYADPAATGNPYTGEYWPTLSFVGSGMYEKDIKSGASRDTVSATASDNITPEVEPATSIQSGKPVETATENAVSVNVLDTLQKFEWVYLTVSSDVTSIQLAGDKGEITTLNCSDYAQKNNNEVLDYQMVIKNNVPYLVAAFRLDGKIAIRGVVERDLGTAERIRAGVLKRKEIREKLAVIEKNFNETQNVFNQASSSLDRAERRLNLLDVTRHITYDSNYLLYATVKDDLSLVLHHEKTQQEITIPPDWTIEDIVGNACSLGIENVSYNKENKSIVYTSVNWVIHEKKVSDLTTNSEYKDVQERVASLHQSSI